MKKVGFYKQDWFVALLIGIAFSAALLSGVPFFEKLENLAYDTGVRMTPRNSGAPTQRYQTGAEMNQDLRACLRDLAQPGAKTG